MSHDHFNPYRDPPPPGGCWTCTHWHGRTNGNPRAVVCERDDQPHCPSLPDQGCVFWEREPGADDEIPPACARREA